MTHPKELWEDTYLSDKIYPMNLFCNTSGPVAPGQNILYLHWHEHLELILMQKGSAVIHIDSSSYEAYPGDVLLVPSGGLHVGYSTGSEPVAFVSFVFNAALLGELLTDPAYLRYVKPYAEGCQRLPVQLERNAEELKRIRELLEDCVQEFDRKQPGYQVIVKTNLTQVLLLLSRLYPVPRAADQTSGFHPDNRDRFKPLLQRLSANPSEKLSVREAAALVNLSPYHFCKMFKKFTGRTYLDYANMCRMREAERLLRETGMNVTEIAAQVGCGNPNYFTKLFKLFIGRLPSDVRRSARQTEGQGN